MLLAPFELENFREYVQVEGKLSGKILLTIETLTPLFSGGKNSRPGFLIRRKKDGEYFIASSKHKDDYILMKDFQELYGVVKFKDSWIHWVGATAY